jgi:sulfur-oxidizing protein SoxB
MLENAADAVFNPDPYVRHGGDMVRCGGLRYTVAPAKPFGQRISDLALARTDEPIEDAKDYVVASWACAAERVDGPPMWDVLERYIAGKGVVRSLPRPAAKVVRN